jgi:hypothetical protein
MVSRWPPPPPHRASRHQTFGEAFATKNKNTTKTDLSKKKKLVTKIA